MKLNTFAKLSTEFGKVLNIANVFSFTMQNLIVYFFRQKNLFKFDNILI